MLFTNSLKEKIFRPQIILLISIIVAALYILYAALKFSGDKLFNQYYYVVPIIFPFTIFLIYRAEGLQQRKWGQWLIDSAVIITAMWRVIGDVPYVSGHTLFLTYCIFTVNSLFGRIIAMIVMIEVLYLKLFIWNDSITCLVGIFLGVMAAVLEKRYKAE